MNSMEKQKGSITSSGYNVSDKKSSSNNSDFNAVVSSKHSDITEPLLFTSKMATQNDLDRPFGGGGGGDGDVGGDERVGSTSCTDGGANDVVMSSIYSRENISVYPYYNVHGENIGASTSTNLQPFDIFASYPNNPYYKSPGGMNGSVGIPFTPAQWKELERQAMIYKYMISAVPVPNDLLFPLSRPFSADPSLYNVRYTKNGDPEPGRCKRTDGKKWRCSRDVAPHQKYCERHLHRGRPRSRKPVEITKNNNSNNGSIENKKKTRAEIPKANTSQQFVPAATSEPLLLFNAKSDLSISTNRDLSLMMETENRWQNLFEPNMGFSNQGSSIYGSNSPIFHQDYIQNQPSLNVFSYPTYPTASEIEAPIGFIDAWSMDNLNSTNNGDPKSSVSPNDENLSTSLNLSMAMAAGNVLDEQMGNIKMGNNDHHKISDYHHDHHNTTKNSRWLCPVSWAGGPLAEALQPGSAIVGPTNPGPPSPHESISNTATTVSSPSGVIQRTLFSNSDGSVCNSPTVPSEALFQWLN